jgi:hypothetical protein
MKREPMVFLNDTETFSSIEGCIIIDENNMAFDLAHVWDRLPTGIRGACLIGMAENHVKLNALEEMEGSWPP